MTTLKLYNTETRQKEEIIPIKDNTIKMYTCGPTVYNYAHIGNFRTYVFEDLLRRTLKFFGFNVLQVMNITDVDDKTINGANREKISLKEFTDTFKKAFFDNLKELNIQQVEYYPEATKYISQMIEIIAFLLEKKIAYRGTDGSIYFSIAHFPSYGRLSHLNLSDLQHGASKRIEADEYDKDNLSDFVLWKAYDEKRDGLIYWESPFGKGRPGWHIECSAMAISLLGKTIDIHCGGVDNIFPHHENEIAQSESFTSVCFVKYWVHVNHLIVENKKMSKSLNNFYTLKDLLDKGYSGRQLRYLLLQTHYRTQLNFTMKGLDAAKASLARIFDFISRLKEISNEKDNKKVEPIIERTIKSFKSALADDMNISQALAAIFDMIREVNFLCDKELVSKSEAQNILEMLKQLDLVLAIFPLEEANSIPDEIMDLVNKRNIARKEKNWALADEIRDNITKKGYYIEDTPSGVKIKK